MSESIRAFTRRDVPYAVRKFGRNADIDTNTDPEDVWMTGGIYSGFNTQTETVEVFSSSAADTSAGTGARTVTISGLASATATEYTTETITLNGVGAVASVGSWYRVNRAWVATAGSGAVNAGNITVRHTTTTTNVFATIAIAHGQTEVCAWTVPYGATMYITGWGASHVISGGGNGSATMVLFTRSSGGAWRGRAMADLGSEAMARDWSVFTEVSGMTDIKAQVLEVTVSNSVVTAFFEAHGAQTGVRA